MADFTAAKFCFRLRPEGMLLLPPAQRGAILRGAFGTALRRIICHDWRRGCLECPTLHDCLFQRLFAPVTFPAAERLSRNQNPPRGFVIEYPLDGADSFGPETTFDVGMTLVGELVLLLPYVVVPLKELGRAGIGPGRGRFRLAAVTCHNPLSGEQADLYSERTGSFRNSCLSVTWADVARRAETLDPRRLTLDFLTPTRLTTGSRPGQPARPVRRPEFGVLLRRLRDRVNALSTFYCGGPLDIDFRGLGERAEAVRLVRDETRWVEASRRSRAGYSQDMAGFVGRATYEGDLREFLPLIAWGELLHVGKGSVFGQGWYRIVDE